MSSQYFFSIQRFIKRVLDVFVAASLLILLLPVFLTLCVLIAVQMGRPIFFFQVRPGKNGKLFSIIKFRTMLSQPKDHHLEDFERFTPLGLVMRNLSLDEIPQLYNVLKGDLSLVGPRPLLVEYLPLYSKRQQLRHKVPPGITGWAQINGRNSISWEEKFEYDIWYVENWSLLLDLKILCMTFFKVIRRDGVNSANDVTMKKFTGTQ
ncbi:MAG: sugar transferase [Bacteriovorax sp.]|jgi:lipopolysaccharide/colanic/teichoic acid biosynthesis glycosyltransferase